MIIFKISVPALVKLTSSLSLGSLIICIVTSVHLHWKESTATHCHVYNILPTISASISLSPERYIWRVGIALTSIRFLMVFLYYHFYEEVFCNTPSYFCRLVQVTVGSHAVEILSLMFITNISSTENFEVHKCSFISFFVSGFLYMGLTCYLFTKFGQIQHNKKNYRSLKLKATILFLKGVFFMSAMYFYQRHYSYCESGVYSLFAFAEYAVVMMNIFFHMTAIIDFRGANIQVPIKGLLSSSTSFHPDL